MKKKPNGLTSGVALKLRSDVYISTTAGRIGALQELYNTKMINPKTGRPRRILTKRDFKKLMKLVLKP